LRLTSACSDGSEAERARDDSSCRDSLQSHRELLYQLAALPMPRNAACRMLAKRQGAHDYFLICLSPHSVGALATTKPQEYLSAAAVAVRCDGNRLRRFVYWIAMRDQRC